MICVGNVEIDPFCQKVLKKHWPDVPLIADVKEVQGDEFGAVDLICGGPPCQPVSLAGKRQGQDDDRWLWGEALRLVEVVRPTWCLFENPPGIVSMGLDRILADLEGFVYSTGTFEIPACAVDAPHIRQRVWIVAHANGGHTSAERLQRSGEHGQQPQDKGTGQLAHAEGQRRQPGPADNVLDGNGVESRGGEPVQPPLSGEDVSDLGATKSRGRLWNSRALRSFWSGHEWVECADGKYRRVKPGVRLLAHGVSGRVARLRALGNAVVPQVVEKIGQAILKTQMNGKGNGDLMEKAD